jgi:hypothetical protein
MTSPGMWRTLRKILAATLAMLLRADRGLRRQAGPRVGQQRSWCVEPTRAKRKQSDLLGGTIPGVSHPCVPIQAQ